MKIQERLSRMLVEAHPAEAAEILEPLPAPAAAAALESFPPGQAAALVRHVHPTTAAGWLLAVPPAGAGAILSELPHDLTARVLGLLGEPERERLLSRAPRATATALGRLLRHPAGTAGALMDPRVPALRQDIRATDARRRLRRRKDRVLYYLYVVDGEHRLVGVLDLGKLILAPPETTLGELMEAEVTHLSVHAGRKAILSHPGWRDHHALPVIDAGGALVGVLRYGTLRRLESERDPARGAGPLELGVSLGELYWTGASALLGEIVALGARLSTRGAGRGDVG